MMRWIWLALLCGCLEYEVSVETVVDGDGEVRRSARIVEKSDEPKTWERYAEPGEPYEFSGDEGSGFLARAREGAGGVRVRAGGGRVREGTFRVAIDDLGFGVLYCYEEILDLGIDHVKFRAELGFALETLMQVAVAAFETLEPELDFAPVREAGYQRVLPAVKAPLLAIHTQLVRLNESGVPVDGALSMRELRRDSRFRVILAELGKLGLKRVEGAPEAKTLDEFVNDDHWVYDESLFLRRLLESLEGVSDERKARMVRRLVDNGKHQDEGPDLAERAWARAVPVAKRPYIEKRLREFAVAAVGALVVENLFDTHRFLFRVRMPGKLILTNGQLQDSPAVVWRFGSLQLVNPRFRASSFEASDAMVGRIRDARKLLEFAGRWRDATDEQRAATARFLDRAREKGLSAAFELAEQEDWKLLESLEGVLGKW